MHPSVFKRLTMHKTNDYLESRIPSEIFILTIPPKHQPAAAALRF
jgi:hypothetical protein